MAHEAAVQVVNTIHEQLAGIVRDAINALKDGHIDAMEGMMLGMRAMSLSSAIIPLLGQATPQVRNDVLYVLEHGQIVMPDTP
jgi:predicted TIM-barrel enzyme